MLPPRKSYWLLLRRFGPQGWWPVTPMGARRARYHPGRFSSPVEREAAEICLGAILTQNTAWTNVEKALESLHAARAVDLAKIARMPGRRLQRLIRSSGFFVQKAAKLKAFARHALARGKPLKVWLKGPLPLLREELLSIHGVGPETADSMLLYAGARRIFMVDAYTRRIGRRLGWLHNSAGYEETQAYLAARLPRSARIYQEFHALLVALAKNHCRKKDPLCAGCPLERGCAHARVRARVDKNVEGAV